MALVGRMAAREWRDDQLVQTIEYLKESANEIKFIQHLRTCRECRLEAELSIERYGGRGLPWFFDLINDPYEAGFFQDGDEDPYPGRPHTEDYKIGSYWTGSSQDTLRFIDDRSKWAENIIRQQIMMAVQFYKQLRNWDLNGEAPTEPQRPY